jgi:hypothetical protein
VTESKQHENAVKHLKLLLESIGALILENDDERGKGGYRFPRCNNGINDVEYVVDVYAIMPDGKPVGFEVDGVHSGGGHNSPIAAQKSNRRDFFFHLFGILLIHYPTSWVNTLNVVDVMRDIKYFHEAMRKDLEEERNARLLVMDSRAR